MPVASPARLTLAEIESVSVVVVPEAVERLNQAALSDKLHDKVPPVGFVRLMSWAAGFALPAMPEKLRAVGVSRIVGAAVEDPATESDTGIDAFTVRPLKFSVEIITVDV